MTVPPTSVGVVFAASSGSSSDKNSLSVVGFSVLKTASPGADSPEPRGIDADQPLHGCERLRELDVRGALGWRSERLLGWPEAEFGEVHP
jgi:hypothetical protein